MCRAAQVLNMEEALRRLDATRVALQEEYDAVFATKVRSLHCNPLCVFRSLLPYVNPFDVCLGALERDGSCTDHAWGGHFDKARRSARRPCKGESYVKGALHFIHTTNSVF